MGISAQRVFQIEREAMASLIREARRAKIPLSHLTLERMTK
jgi:hypothetical protein